MKEADHRDTTIFFSDYRDIKFKLTAHRLVSENRNTVLWNKNYRNTAPKITQYRNTANPYAPLNSVDLLCGTTAAETFERWTSWKIQ